MNIALRWYLFCKCKLIQNDCIQAWPGRCRLGQMITFPKPKGDKLKYRRINHCLCFKQSFRLRWHDLCVFQTLPFRSALDFAERISWTVTVLFSGSIWTSGLKITWITMPCRSFGDSIFKRLESCSTCKSCKQAELLESMSAWFLLQRLLIIDKSFAL